MSTSIADLRSVGASGGNGNIPARTMGLPDGMFDNMGVGGGGGGNSMMTPMSNSVGNIGNPMGTANDSQFLNELFSDLGVNNLSTNPSDINSQAIEYAMEGAAHIPPDKNGAALPTPIAVKNQYQAEMEAAANNKLFNGGDSNNNDRSIMISSGNYVMDLVHRYVKMPAIVFVIVFIVSLPQFNRFIFNFFPSLILESGQISILGITLKSFIALIFAIIINYFVAV